MDLDVHMTKEEAVLLAKLAGGEIQMKLDPDKKTAPYVMNIKGGCQFLKDGACSIHEQRPNACRNFPHRPIKGCAVWEA
jgi:Fe-S-cluster containining protein